MREQTGYYDRKGKAICDGDRIKAIFATGDILVGFVDTDFNGDWILVGEYWSAPLYGLDDIEILEGDE